MMDFRDLDLGMKFQILEVIMEFENDTKMRS